MANRCEQCIYVREDALPLGAKFLELANAMTSASEGNQFSKPCKLVNVWHSLTEMSCHALRSLECVSSSGAYLYFCINAFWD